MREEDDGRVIADMSDVGRPGYFIPGNIRKRPDKSYRGEDAVEKKPWEMGEMLSPEEKRMYILGALKAALLIAFAFIAGLGLVILLLIMLWT